jgi:multicomponent Na+:H+ antiporter subunit F
MIPDWVVNVFDGMLLASLVLCVGRMAIGPSAADRMVAIDLLGLLAAVLMVSHAIRSAEEAVLDVVLVFSVVAFFGTVALARYLQRQSDQPSDPQ